MSAAPHPVPIAAGPVDHRIRPPGSKSETIRALAAACLADGRSHLYGALDADDTMAMAGVIRALGVDVATNTEPWSVDGQGGRLSPPQLPLDARESGLCARIGLVLAGSADGTSVMQGRGRLGERPLSSLIATLRDLGVEIDGDRLPIEVTGHGRLWGGTIAIDCSETTQFATALMLAAPTMQEPALLELKGLTGSVGYLELTATTMRRFGASVERTFTGYEVENTGYQPADVVVEPDASAAAYPMVAAAITGGRVTIEGIPSDSRQPDLAVTRHLRTMGCETRSEAGEITVIGPTGPLQPLETDLSDTPDGALALAVACLFAKGVSRLSGLGSLRHKESNRLDALSQELSRLGAGARVEDDTLVVTPANLHPSVVDPHGDHRVAMALGLVGLVVPGIAVDAPGVVDKTWPGFWTMLDDLSR